MDVLRPMKDSVIPMSSLGLVGSETGVPRMGMTLY